jgi:hypothetical protein
VGDEHDGDAAAGPDRQQLALELLSGERIERAERLVHQQDAGIVGEHARNGDALLHAAGELVRVAIGGALEAYEFHELVGDRLHLGARQPPLARAEADVLAHRHPGEQRVVLEHHAAVAAGAADALAVDEDLAAGWLLEAGDDAQHSGLAAAGSADQTDELALRDGRIDAAERFDLAVANGKPFGHAADGDVDGFCLRHGAAGSIAAPDC